MQSDESLHYSSGNTKEEKDSRSLQRRVLSVAGPEKPALLGKNVLVQGRMPHRSAVNKCRGGGDTEPALQGQALLSTQHPMGEGLFYPHFIGEQTEAQKGYPRSHGWA